MNEKSPLINPETVIKVTKHELEPKIVLQNTDVDFDYRDLSSVKKRIRMNVLREYREDTEKKQEQDKAEALNELRKRKILKAKHEGEVIGC
jgi:UDP-N-acetylenolpyruvoylglucosamine reductase